jgi:hypothetical protein
MSVSPSPERIEICTPPDSPKIEFNGREWSSPEIMFPASLGAVVTPPKALRGVLPRRGVKRRRPDSVDVAVNTPNDGKGTNSASDVFGEHIEGSSPGESEQTISNTLDLEGSTWSNYSEVITEHGLEGGTLSATCPELTWQDVDPFEHYADAALADCSGFFQISEMLFVVQGWDAKGQRSTVSRHHFQDAR